MTFEVWDRASGNRLGAFDSVEAAFALVRDVAEDEGEESAAALVLGVEGARGSQFIADGADLVYLAQHRATAG